MGQAVRAVERAGRRVHTVDSRSTRGRVSDRGGSVLAVDRHPKLPGARLKRDGPGRHEDELHALQTDTKQLGSAVKCVIKHDPTEQ